MLEVMALGPISPPLKATARARPRLQPRTIRGFQGGAWLGGDGDGQRERPEGFNARLSRGRRVGVIRSRRLIRQVTRITRSAQQEQLRGRQPPPQGRKTRAWAYDRISLSRAPRVTRRSWLGALRWPPLAPSFAPPQNSDPPLSFPTLRRGLALAYWLLGLRLSGWVRVRPGGQGPIGRSDDAAHTHDVVERSRGTGHCGNRDRPGSERNVMKRFGLVIVLVFPLSLLASDFAFAADDSKVKAGMEQVERGAKKIPSSKIGEGVEETAKGIGATVSEGAKYSGEKLKEAGQAAEPPA